MDYNGLQWIQVTMDYNDNGLQWPLQWPTMTMDFNDTGLQWTTIKWTTMDYNGRRWTTMDFNGITTMDYNKINGCFIVVSVVHCN